MGDVRRRPVFTGLAAAIVLLASSFHPAAAERGPIAVSPGSIEGSFISTICPTFSWGEIDGATSYEIVVFRLTEEGSEPVLSESFPGSVESWTPSLDRCLEWGRDYAWSVRALGSKPGNWSQTLLFSIVPDGKGRPARAREDARPPGVRVVKGQVLEDGRYGSSPETLTLAPLALAPQGADRAPNEPGVLLPSNPSLSIEGDMVLGGSIHHKTPKVRKVLLTAADFVPTGDDFWLERRPYDVYIKSGAPPMVLVAPVHSIPAGALVTNLECRVVDNHATYWVACGLWHSNSDLGAGSNWVADTLSLSPDSSPQTITDPSGIPTTVRADERLWVEFYPSDDACDVSCYLHWVTITYLVYELD